MVSHSSDRRQCSGFLVWILGVRSIKCTSNPRLTSSGGPRTVIHAAACLPSGTASSLLWVTSLWVSSIVPDNTWNWVTNAFTAFRVHFSACVAKLRTATISFIMSVRLSACNNSALSGRIFIEFDIWVLFEILSIKFKFHYDLTRIKDTLREKQCIYLIISCSVLLVMRIFSGGKKNL